MFIAQAPIITFAANQPLRPISAMPRAPKGDGQLVGRIMIRRHESSRSRVPPSAFRLRSSSYGGRVSSNPPAGCVQPRRRAPPAIAADTS